MATFTEFVAQLEDGQVQADATDQLKELVEAMHRRAETTGGKPKGKLTLTVDLKLDDGVFEVNANIAVKAPTAVRRRSILYRAPDGGLSANNPRQLDLGITGPPKDVSTRAAGQLRSM